MAKGIYVICVALAAAFSAGLLIHMVFGSEMVSWLAAMVVFASAFGILRD